MRSASCLAIALLPLALTACTPFSLSPPARTLPLESSATLDEGQVSVGASGGFHEASADVGSASVRVRIGVAEMVEAQLEGSYLYVGYGDERSPHLGAGRLGIKIAPAEWIGLIAGIGGGAHTHGAFAAPDAGIVLAYENPYVVPWGAFRGFVSVPISERAVAVTRTDSDGIVDTFVLTPPDTAGWQVSTGIRVPLVFETFPDRSHRDSRFDLLIGAGYSRFYGLDGQDTLGVWHFESAIELVVDP